MKQQCKSTVPRLQPHMKAMIPYGHKDGSLPSTRSWLENVGSVSLTPQVNSGSWFRKSDCTRVSVGPKQFHWRAEQRIVRCEFGQIAAQLFDGICKILHARIGEDLSTNLKRFLSLLLWTSALTDSASFKVLPGTFQSAEPRKEYQGSLVQKKSRYTRKKTVIWKQESSSNLIAEDEIMKLSSWLNDQAQRVKKNSSCCIFSAKINIFWKLTIIQWTFWRLNEIVGPKFLCKPSLCPKTKQVLFSPLIEISTKR